MSELTNVAGATFQGFVRPDGGVGTRNFIGVLVVGNCGATAARQVADYFDVERLAEFPNVDGVVPFVHEIGCGMEMTGEPMDLLRRTISGHIRNPNIAAALVIALGCERNNLRSFLDQEKLALGDSLHTITIQDIGGMARAVAEGKRIVAELLPRANFSRRQQVSAAHLVVGLKSSAADRFCPLSADPALAVAVAKLVACGGTAIVSETPDLLANPQPLLARAATPELRQSLRERLDWWATAIKGRDIPTGVTPGVLDKTGVTPISAVLRYAEKAGTPGLVFMDGPSYDPVCVTGQIAAGATLIAMTTGRGVSFGSLPAPTLKIAAGDGRVRDDIDINCAAVLDGTSSIEAMGALIFQSLLWHASGEKTKSEADGMGENEFVPWPIGVVA